MSENEAKEAVELETGDDAAAAPEASEHEVRDGEGHEGGHDGEAHGKSGEREERSVQSLEEEGEIAADYLEELLDIFDLDGDIDIDVRQGRAYVAISSEDSASNVSLISNPETVEALQELTRLAVQVKTNTFSRLILDVGGSRQKRADDIARIVGRIIDKVKDLNEPVHMKPMSSYERKIVHDLVAEAGLVSESEGEGKDRHIVVKPA